MDGGRRTADGGARAASAVRHSAVRRPNPDCSEQSGSLLRMAVAGRVFTQLAESVLRYEPGEKLPTQRALAAELGVTMTALREALKRLEQLGLVEVRHGDAMRVADWRSSGGGGGVGARAFPAGGPPPAAPRPGRGGPRGEAP